MYECEYDMSVTDREFLSSQNYSPTCINTRHKYIA